MNKTITLPSGNTVELKDPATLLKKDRDKVLSYGSGLEDVMRFTALQDGVIAVSIVNWSFDLIPPSIRISSLGELTPRDYEALIKATADVQDYLFPNFEQNEITEQDPKVNTANYND